MSADIRANTNLRIALRVTDAAESTDVIDAPDAAHISRATPGRAYVRLGHASLVPFQAGRIGGRRPGATAAQPARWFSPVAWPDLGRPEPRRPQAQAAGRRGGHRSDRARRADPAAPPTGCASPPSTARGCRRCRRTLLLRDLPVRRDQATGTGQHAACPFGLDRSSPACSGSGQQC